jgi:TetR/AcrR family transcriptional repressor of nem operon
MTVSAPRSRTQSTLLVPVVVATVASRCSASWMAYVPTPPELETFVRFYLSPEQREQHADGCPSAALLDELVRRPDATRQVFTDELLGVIGDIASRLDPTDVAAARTDALTVFGLMVGTLQVARALTDRDLSDRLLARGVQTALALLDDRASDAGVTREPRRALAAS